MIGDKNKQRKNDDIKNETIALKVKKQVSFEDKDSIRTDVNVNMITLDAD